MRALSVAFVVAVCLTAGVCATHPLREAAAKLAAAHKDLLQVFDIADLHSRSLDVAQTAGHGVVPPVCASAEFQGVFTVVGLACQTEAATAGAAQTDAARAAAAKAFCTTGKCLGMIATMVVGTPYEQCVPPGSKYGKQLGELRAGCQPSPTGLNCFEQQLKAGEVKKTCESATTRNSCVAIATCTWESSKGEGNTASGKCTVGMTAASIALMCTDCLDQMIRASGNSELVLAKNVMCSKVGNTHCAPILQPMLEGATTTALALDSMCSPASMPCVTKFLGALAASERAKGMESYAKCMQSAGTSVSSKAICAQQLAGAIQTAGSYSFYATNACKKTGAGAYCQLAVAAVGTTMQNCSRGCNDACRTAIGAAVDAAGCCLGSFDEPAPPLTAADLPAGATWAAPTPQPPLPPQPTASPAPTTTAGAKGPVPPGETSEDRANANPGRLEATIAAYCPIPDLRARFAKRCAVTRVKGAMKALKVPLIWSKINANPALKARLQDSFAFDVAVAAGIPRTDVLSVTFKEDASQKIKPSFAAPEPRGRKLQVAQAAPESGVTADVSIAASSETDQAAAIKALDTAIASNTATFAATASTAEGECPECLGVDGAAGLNNAGKLNSPSTAGTRVTVFAAVVVAVIAALAF